MRRTFLNNEQWGATHNKSDSASIQKELYTVYVP